MDAQNKLVLQYLQRHGSITPKDADRELGCMRLGARIFDLRQMGYSIRTDKIKGVNRFGRKVSYASYRLVEDDV